MTGLWLLALFAASPEPPATPPPKPAAYELSWQAPDGCPGLGEIQRRVLELAPSPEGGNGVMLVEGAVDPTSAGFALRLKTTYLDETDNRVIQGETCDELAETTALFVAVALEPTLSTGGAEHDVPVQVPTTPRQTPPPAVAPAAEHTGSAQPPTRVEYGPTIQVTPADEPPPPRRRATTPSAFALRIAPELEFGALPGVSGGPRLTALLLWPRFRAEVFGHYLLPRGAQGPAPSEGRVQLGAAGGRACYRLFAGRVEFPVCASLEAGALRVDSRGLNPSNTLHFAWLAPGAAAALALGGERVGFFAGADVAIAALRSRILVGDDPIFATRVASLRLVVGLEIFFPIQRD